MNRKLRRLFFACLLILASSVIRSGIADAPDIGYNPANELNQDRPNAPWITRWYALDGPISNNGGFGPSSDIDWIDQGTNGKLSQDELSTVPGVRLTKTNQVNLPNNGGELGWQIVEINPADENNMSHMVGLVNAIDNFETYAIIAIDTPQNHTAVMSPSHDDFAHIWINGEKIYANHNWTGGATFVDYDIEVDLVKGTNILLFRCGESGGGDYFNLHFDDNTNELVNVFPDSDDVNEFHRELERGFAVDPTGKLAVTWGSLR